MIVFDVYNVTKVYPRRSVPANRNISLQIHRGEIFGLLGDNSVGKTTLVRHLVALLPPAVRQTLVGPVTIRLALDVSVMLGITIASFCWVGKKMTWRAE